MTPEEFKKHRIKYVSSYLDKVSYNYDPEKEVEGVMEKYFSKYFKVYRQLASDCRKKKVDLLLEHRSGISFIVEIKHSGKKSGCDIGSWAKQASEYSNYFFLGKKHQVLVFPQISGTFLDEGAIVSTHDVFREKCYNVNSFLFSSLGIGEIRIYEEKSVTGYAIIVNNRILWKSQDHKNTFQ